jgi:hypothetical protein
MLSLGTVEAYAPSANNRPDQSAFDQVNAFTIRRLVWGVESSVMYKINLPARPGADTAITWLGDTELNPWTVTQGREGAAVPSLQGLASPSGCVGRCGFVLVTYPYAQ